MLLLLQEREKNTIHMDANTLKEKISGFIIRKMLYYKGMSLALYAIRQ